MNLVNQLRLSARAFSILALTIAAGASLVIPAQQAAAQTDTLSAADLAAIQQAVQTALANIDPNLTGAARTQAVNQALVSVATTFIPINGAAVISPIITAAITGNVPAPQAIAALMPASVNLGVPPATVVTALTVGAVAAGTSPTQASEAIIAVAAQTGTSSAAVGSGLGQAATTFARSNNAGAATQVAQVVSNEGTTGTGQSFSSTVVSTGGTQQLANAGLQNPNATSLTGATTTTTNTAGAPASTSAAASLSQGASQQISGIGTTITCNNPSCS